MLERIIKEKISADHLLHVSLKYTKTCDVIINLILRWRVMIEQSFDALLIKSKKKKLISSIPEAPLKKIEKLKQVFKKEEVVIQVIEMYEMFRKIEQLDKICEHEFRKNATLDVMYKGQKIELNIENLKEYGKILENFISYIKQSLS